MERNRLTEQSDILLQELLQLKQIIVVLEGNRSLIRESTQKERWMSYHNLCKGCVLHLTH